MVRMSAFLGLAMSLLVACDEVVVSSPGPAEPAAEQKQTRKGTMTPSQASRAFVEVTRKMEPLIERECRAQTKNVDCDFRIVVDDRPDQPANAYQTLDRNGRPIIAFTLTLIAEASNVHELAFVMGHEAAHHIQGHISRQQQNAIAGALIFTGLATLGGGDVETAQKLGARVGARTYSKEFELEADELGTILTIKAGYDPLIGAQFFNRIPDPGNRFLGTHPPNAQRIAKVRETAAKF